MNHTLAFSINQVAWAQEKTRLSTIRSEVFIAEQHVPPALEWDGLDETATHLLALDADDRAIGCARILNHASIGRMAVLKNWRGQGVGSALLSAAIELCRRHGRGPIRLSAQVHAIPFYAAAGFTVCSVEYPDAGIPHRDMQLP